MILNDHDTFDQEKIAHCFNKFFVSIGPKLASLIIGSKQSLTCIWTYIKPSWVKQTFIMMN